VAKWLTGLECHQSCSCNRTISCPPLSPKSRTSNSSSQQPHALIIIKIYTLLQILKNSKYGRGFGRMYVQWGLIRRNIMSFLSMNFLFGDLQTIKLCMGPGIVLIDRSTDQCRTGAVDGCLRRGLSLYRGPWMYNRVRRLAGWTCHRLRHRIRSVSIRALLMLVVC
jgi:hypothetical protein